MIGHYEMPKEASSHVIFGIKEKSNHNETSRLMKTKRDSVCGPYRLITTREKKWFGEEPLLEGWIGVANHHNKDISTSLQHTR